MPCVLGELTTEIFRFVSEDANLTLMLLFAEWHLCAHSALRLGSCTLKDYDEREALGCK